MPRAGNGVALEEAKSKHFRCAFDKYPIWVF